MHGGKAPQVARSAKERLAALVDPSIDALRRAIQSKDYDASVRAARDILDRVMGRAAFELSGPGGRAITIDTPSVTTLNLAALSEDELRELRRLLTKAYGDEPLRAGVVVHRPGDVERHSELFSRLRPTFLLPSNGRDSEPGA